MPRTDQWFSTSRLRPDVTRHGLHDPEVFLIHAKQVGTMVSACGLNTLSWYKYWDPFHYVVTDRACPACVAAVAGFPREAAQQRIAAAAASGGAA